MLGREEGKLIDEFVHKFWSAPAERSGDGALDLGATQALFHLHGISYAVQLEAFWKSKAVSPDKSGLPPHSKISRI